MARGGVGRQSALAFLFHAREAKGPPWRAVASGGATTPWVDSGCGGRGSCAMHAGASAGAVGCSKALR
jgi:hypothetical protein